jgi:phosphate transport system permease protein
MKKKRARTDVPPKTAPSNYMMSHEIESDPTVEVSGKRRSRKRVDDCFRCTTMGMALGVIALMMLVGIELYKASKLSIDRFGWKFIGSSEWDPVNEQFGALPFIYGTFVSSLIALLVAAPLGVGTALYLTEMAPRWIREPLIFMVELLSAIPSVILGLWGIFVMVPWFREFLFPGIKGALGFLPIFQGPIYGVSMLAGGLIIAIMILPMITAVSREIIRSVPDLQREAAYALGATHWEVIRIAVLRYSKGGIFGAMILGLGRALGETMAVTMVIGNRPEIAKSLFAPGYTLASVVANEFAEAASDLYLSSLFELGLVLLGITVLVNLLAQGLLKTFGGRSGRARS